MTILIKIDLIKYLLRSKILQALKSKTNGHSKIRKAQSVNQCPFKMGKRKPKLING